MYQQPIPYGVSSVLFSAYSSQPHSMMLASLGRAQNGSDLLLLEADTVQSAWLHQNQSNTLTLADGSTTSLNALIQASHQVQQQRGGVLAGYLSYEVAHCLETLPATKPATTMLPDVFIAHYHVWIELNHNDKSAILFAPNQAAAQVSLNKIDESKISNFKCLNGFSNSEPKDKYHSNINKILDYIDAGDCYQINYSQHFSAPYNGNSFAAYTRIAESISAPYAAYINTGAGELLSFSPEQFIAVDANRNVRTRPIKGTAARGNTPAADQDNANALLASAKNRAENLMIVDLLRHDLGKCCRTGSIKVEELFKLETYTNVHHLVSTISGILNEDHTPLSALLSAFPGGSITGAPKVRAMEIINELEQQRRSAYCGTVFYQKPDGSFDSNIMIRTLVASENTLHCWGGGGIVADSDPEQEHQETLDKIEVYMRLIEQLS